MSQLDHIKNVLKGNMDEFTRKYHVARMAIFGSYARGDQNEKSDVDVLVEFDQPIGLEFVDLADHLEHLLDKKVDLVSRGAVKPNRMRYISEELIYV